MPQLYEQKPSQVTFIQALNIHETASFCNFPSVVGNYKSLRRRNYPVLIVLEASLSSVNPVPIVRGQVRTYPCIFAYIAENFRAFIGADESRMLWMAQGHPRLHR